MKRFTKILALSLALILSVMMLASCSILGPKPNKDPKKAEDALKENGYTCELLDTATALKITAEMVDCGDLTAYLSAVNDDLESIQILWFEESEDAKDYYEELKETQEELIKDLKQQKDDMDEDLYDKTMDALKDVVIGRSGKMVWKATCKDAVKAAK